MKKILQNLFSLTLFFILLTSCNDYSSQDFEKIDIREQNIENNCSNDFNVSYKDAENYAKTISFKKDDKPKISSISPYIFKKDTTAYLINYEGAKGWILISADRRYKIILASSDKGSLDIGVLNKSNYWLNSIMSDIYRLKRTNDFSLNSKSYNEWKIIDIVNGIRKNNNSLRVTNPMDTEPELEKQYLSYNKTIEYIDKVPHLIKTKWGQGAPWNSCVPYIEKTKYDESRAYTGCVAVTAAQTLYYINSIMKNRQLKIPTKGHWEANINDSWKKIYSSFNFGDFRDDIWNKMPLDVNESNTNLDKNAEYVAVLMGYIGSEIDMVYRESGSGSNNYKLIGLYRKFGISSEYLEYNIDRIINSLKNKLPINIQSLGYDNEKNIDLDWGHSWIIDGYGERVETITRKYRWMPKGQSFFDDGDDERIGPETGGGSLADEFLKRDSLPTNSNNGTFPILYSINSNRYREHENYRQVYTEETKKVTYYLYMNLGWPSSPESNDIKYEAITDEAWDTKQYFYRRDKEIICNFQF